MSLFMWPRLVFPTLNFREGVDPVTEVAHLTPAVIFSLMIFSEMSTPARRHCPHRVKMGWKGVDWVSFRRFSSG